MFREVSTMCRSLSLSLLVPLFFLTPPAARAADDDPLVQGKRLSEWIEMARGDKMRADRATALQALGCPAGHPNVWKWQIRLREAGLLGVSLAGTSKSPQTFP